MLAGGNVACGTSTTGTGTLTCAAVPTAVGAVDLYTWLTALGFSSGKVLNAPLTIIEYTDSTFTKPSQQESGIYTVTLGASLAATTIARTTIMSSEIVGTPSYDATSAPAAINIGTAANVLIFPSANEWAVPAFSPYYDETVGTTFGITTLPSLWAYAPNVNFLLSTDGSGTDWYGKFALVRPVFAKVMRAYVNAAYSGTTGTPISAAYGRIYQIGTDGKPGRLLVDFGSFGTNPLNATGVISATASTGVLLMPGEYWTDFFATFSGAGGTVVNPKIYAQNNGLITAWNLSAASGRPCQIATGGSSSASDPANVTGWAESAVNTNQGAPFLGIAKA